MKSYGNDLPNETPLKRKSNVGLLIAVVVLQIITIGILLLG